MSGHERESVHEADHTLFISAWTLPPSPIIAQVWPKSGCFVHDIGTPQTPRRLAHLAGTSGTI
ncbi:hypothetical protein SCP_0509810 [Sparassis crispa]|uniref:Uncharacterized protein n=1 Tax=Sparassis crispa TaxID=139825 RepID=A0A401GNZ1_9APHY|nr:hypothetical protein SCP_0509810 [Sparassis crispa]GBE83922.1 hypothetical protein SCP_0509810 [Sparassis crispa]